MLPYGFYLVDGEPFSGHRLEQMRQLLNNVGLDYDNGIGVSVGICNGNDDMIAAASLQENIIKCVAVSPEYEALGLTAELLQYLFAKVSPNKTLFVYTKPKNRPLFECFGFAALANTGTVLLMERPRGSVGRFLESLPPPSGENIGAVVANCNPMTLGHLWLIDSARKECDFLYVFVLSEDKSEVPAKDRLEIVRRSCAQWENVAVCPTGPYLVSSATFPAYFLKDKVLVNEQWCELDPLVFAQWFCPKLRITKRYVGSEPFSPITAAYNKQLAKILPGFGISVTELNRFAVCGQPVSATRVRALLRQNCREDIRSLVPDATWHYFCDLQNYASFLLRDTEMNLK
ncbi:MAG: hypothetical protein AB7D36_00670 [Oscillospiraceae bacterium]